MTTAAADQVVGRDDELVAIRAFLGEGSMSALVLEGAAGIGKTTLWLAGVELARERGYDVLGARPAGTEVTLSLAGLGDVLRGLPEQATDHLPSPQRQALAVALAEGDGSARQLDSHVLGTALLNLLRVRAEKSPVLLAIDDLQWLDESSGAVILFALRRAADANIRLLASCRSEPAASLPLGLERSLDERSLLRLTVGPLSEGAMRRLLRQRLGLSISRTQLHAVHDATQGNPFFALELGRAGLEQDEDGVIRLPGSLQALVRRRLQALPVATRDALLYVAALSEPRLKVLDRAGMLAALEPAIEAGILELEGDGVRFAHPLIGAAAWRMAGVERRREVHLALAEASDDPEQRARHLAITTEAPDPEVAALLESVATSARARGAPAAAADLLERARQLTPENDLERWARLSASAAAAHALAGDWDRLMELVEEALVRLPAGPDRAAILIVATEMRPGQAALLRQAVEEAGETAVGVQARIGLAEQAATGGNWHEAIEIAREAVELARRLGRRDLLAAALTSLAGCELLDSRPEGNSKLAEALAIERELGMLPTSAYSSPSTWKMYGLYWVDDLETARPLLEQQIRKARDEGDEVSACQLFWLLGFFALADGSPVRARAFWQEGLELIERLGYEYIEATSVFLLASIEAYEGKLDRARALNGEAMPVLERTDDAVLSTVAHASMLFVELCAGNVPAALAHIDAISAVFPDGRDSWWSRHQGDELEALVLAGEHERALERIDALRHAGAELGLARFLAWAERGQGLLCAARGDLPGAREALESSLRHHERVPDCLERARTLLIYGNVLRRNKQRRAARAALGEARAEFERIGAGHFEPLAAGELKHVAGRAATREGELTETEDRVARLVAGGLSNKEAATRLFVTVSTVEATLTRVYAKLGIRSRAQLVRAMDELASASKEQAT